MTAPREPKIDDDELFLSVSQSDLPWHIRILPIAITGALVAIWLLYPQATMNSWALSGQSLRQDGLRPLLLHMAAHGGLLHLLMNAAGLIVLSAPLIASLGRSPIAFARYSYLLIGSGLLGGALFLAVHPTGSSSMLGASGAIFGLLGALTRINPSTGQVVPLKSMRTWLLAKLFVREHAVVLAVFAVITFLTGSSAGIAWEAHLGGLLFGLLAAPLFLVSADRPRLL